MKKSFKEQTEESIKTITLSNEQIEKINNEEFEKCKNHFDTVIEPNLINYEPTIEKVKYLINEMTKYLNSITPQIIYTSGVIVSEMKNPIPLYLDRFIQNKISELLSIDKLEQGEPSSEKNEPDKLTHKQQILLLHSLGILEIKELKKMNAEQKGILFGNLLNRDEKNTENYIRYIDHKEETKYTAKIEKNILKVKELLSNAQLLTDTIKSKLT